MSTGTAPADQHTAAAAEAASDVVCAVRDLVKTYPAVRGRRGAPAMPETRATDGISLDVRRGEIFGLLGPNGAGKSTLVRQLTGLLRPDTGSVTLLGHDLVGHPERASRLLAYLGQESTALDELTVALAAETTGRLRGLGARQARAARDAVLEELGLTEIAGRPLKKLSGGQRRLACFAAALVGERPVLVLDEPTTGMDPVAVETVLALFAHDRLGIDTFGFGLLLTAEATGGLLGAAIASFLGRRLGTGTALTCTAAVEGLAILGLAAAPNPYVAGLALAVCGAGMGATMVLAPSLRQAIVPAHLMGRVAST
ncbi:MFS transporter, partial [Streptomyces sp. Mg1]|uniref:MFS transporter n=1 Tax=Streptomyces sp. Mg1 TaxID=465541 RepID=UPI001319FF41